MRKNSVQAKEWLDKCYSVKRWYADFKRSRTATNDTEPSGRPNSAIVPENPPKKQTQKQKQKKQTKNQKQKKPHKLVLAHRKLKLRKKAEDLKISEGSAFTILLEHLSIRKLG